MKRYLIVTQFGEGKVLGPFRFDKDRLAVAGTLFNRGGDDDPTLLRLDVRDGRRPDVYPFSLGELEAEGEDADK